MCMQDNKSQCIKIVFCVNCVFLFGSSLLLVSSTTLPWSWMSMALVRCSPVICFQLENSHPQTGVHASDTVVAERHNPADRTSQHSGWCQCPGPCPAGEPLDLPWMSSLPFDSATVQNIDSLDAGTGFSFTWTQFRRVFVTPSYIVAAWDGETGWDHGLGGASGEQVRWTDSSKCKYMYVPTSVVQTGTLPKATRSTPILILWLYKNRCG